MTLGQAEELFRINGFDIRTDRIEALLEYQRLLLEWNTKINLVSRRDTTDFFIRHIVGSISFLFTHSLADRSSLLDVGTGGGLPGIPIAILHPGIRVTMIDSIRKKVMAVERIIGDLRLENTHVQWARAEEFQKKEGRRGEKFDYVIARAVSTSTRLLEWCGPLLAPGIGTRRGETVSHSEIRRPIPPGSIILLKGGDLTEEVAALGDVADTASVTVRSLDVVGSRDLLTEKKVIIISP